MGLAPRAHARVSSGACGLRASATTPPHDKARRQRCKSVRYGRQPIEGGRHARKVMKLVAGRDYYRQGQLMVRRDWWPGAPGGGSRGHEPRLADVHA